MPQRPLDPRELGRYFALAQVGLEMVAPVAVGAVLDHYLNWQPWGLVVGAVLGLITGIYHLVAISNQQNRRDRKDPPRQEPP
jgi:F0F1-type ATP synthase assembly protein I